MPPMHRVSRALVPQSFALVHFGRGGGPPGMAMPCGASLLQTCVRPAIAGHSRSTQQGLPSRGLHLPQSHVWLAPQRFPHAPQLR
jgi:hypothetical protein